MKAVIIAGLARSGKDTVADYLCREYCFSKYVMSDALIAQMKKKKLKINKANISRFGDELRKKKGMAAVAELIYKKVKKSRKKKIAIVGPRSVEEIEFFRHKFLDMKIIRIDAPKGKRFERRSEKDPKEKNDFFARDKRDVKNKGLNKVLKMADIKIENGSSLEDLHWKVDLLLEACGIKG